MCLQHPSCSQQFSYECFRQVARQYGKTNVHTCAYTLTHTHTHTLMCARAHTHTHTHTHVHACMHKICWSRVDWVHRHASKCMTYEGMHANVSRQRERTVQYTQLVQWIKVYLSFLEVIKLAKARRSSQWVPAALNPLTTHSHTFTCTSILSPLIPTLTQHVHPHMYPHTHTLTHVRTYAHASTSTL